MKNQNLFFLILIVLIFLVGCNASLFSPATPTPLPCLQLNTEYSEAVEDILKRWDVVNEKATRSLSDQFALASHGAELGDMVEELRLLKPPECAKGAQDLLGLYMAAEIAGYFLILTGERRELDVEDTAAVQEVRTMFEDTWQSLK